MLFFLLQSFVAGFVSAKLYRQMGGKNWVWNTMTVSMVFPAPLFLVFCVVNSIAWYYSSTAGLPFLTVTAISLMWLIVSFPMTIIGSIIGRNVSADLRTPCRTTKVPREIPKDIPWYRQGAAQMFVSGFLPFSAIYIELHYIFASVWGHKVGVWVSLSVRWPCLRLLTSYLFIVCPCADLHPIWHSHTCFHPIAHSN